MAAQTPHPALSRFIGVLLFALLAALPVGLARPSGAAAFEAKGTISYGYRLCANVSKADPQRLRGAHVDFLDRDGDLAGVATTDGAGHFSAKVGNQAVTAEVVLETPGKFKVVRKGNDPYSFKLGEFTRKNPSKSVGFTADGPGGAMN